jgi:hypothetical protein
MTFYPKLLQEHNLIGRERSKPLANNCQLAEGIEDYKSHQQYRISLPLNTDKVKGSNIL